MTNDVLLRVDGLVKHFPVTAGVFGRVVDHVKAVDGVSFELRRGETLGLVGESGCGKTTVGRSVLRLVEPTSGRIQFDGRELTVLPARELRGLRREMQMIFQDPFSSLNPRMTVLDIVGEALEVHGLARGAEVERRVVDLLEKVGIPSAWVDRYPHEFSGGQRQRIGIARAIALGPKLVVCDEPVSALDVSIQAQVINLLIELRREMNLSYLFIAHDLSVVRHISHRIAVMYLGQLVETAPVKQLFAEPAHPYTRALLSAIPVPQPRRRAERIVLEGDVPTPMHPPSGCRFHTRCPAVMERCRVEEPRSIGVAEGHRVKCFHAYDEGPGPDWYARVVARTEAAVAANRAGRSAREPSGVGSDAAAPGASLPERARDPRGKAAPMPLERIEAPRTLRRRAGAVLLVGGGALALLGAPLVGAAAAGAGFAVGFAREAASKVRWGAAVAAALALCALAGYGLEALARRHEARAQLASLEAELERYAEVAGHYPRTLDELGWRLVAIFGDARAIDPWNRPWRYRPLPDRRPPFELASTGPDRASGGGDDIEFAPPR